jgi:hypothetical protein
LLNAIVAPAFAADGDVAVVTANFHLLTFVDEVAVAVNACVDDCLSATRACAFDFVNCVGNLK